MLIVQKFGGLSAWDLNMVHKAADRVADAYSEGHEIIAVVSSQGAIHKELIAAAHKLTSQPSRRELDMLMSSCEQQAAALLVMALLARGLPAISLTGWQAGIQTTEAHQAGKVEKVNPERLQNELDKNNIVVVAGRQGYSCAENITMLGRHGTDVTAVALAAELQAQLCEIYTRADGVYTADPSIVASAKKLNEISYDEMTELAALGDLPLKGRCVELAKKHKVNLVVRQITTNTPGTYIKEVAKVENSQVSGIALDKNVARITIAGVKDEPGTAMKIFSMISKRGISADLIIQTMGAVGDPNTKDIMFTVSRTDMDTVLEIFENNNHGIAFHHISSDDRLCKLSIVGAGIISTPGIATTVFEALSASGVNIGAIASSEIKISLLIDEKDADKAANAVHDAFTPKTHVKTP